ncbi:MAG: DUF1290 domain-containing protein [Ruminococcaceae bacterium]|nr:DUF1290 domain-containing protein [Oscillospiraceae bacterium]
MILIACVVVGILMGIVFPFYVPQEFSQYLSVVVLAMMDSALGGASAMVRKCFDVNVFVSGFAGNTILALFLTFLGEKLGVDLFLVAVLVFGTRLFNNLSTIRRHYLSKIQIKFKK